MTKHRSCFAGILATVWRTSFCAGLLAIGVAAATTARADDTLRVWIKAFIPSTHPGNPGYVRPIPGLSGSFEISAPVGSDCYMTDNRGFSSNPSASARMTADVVLNIASDSVTSQPGTARGLFYTDPTHDINCATGADLNPSRSADTSSMHAGTPAFADGVAQIVLDCRGSNPFYLVAPDIRYGGTITFDTASRKLRFQGSAGVFPAFEAYARLNDGPSQPLFQLNPGQGTTVLSLIDLGGLNQQAIDVTVSMGSPAASIKGDWSGPSLSQNDQRTSAYLTNQADNKSSLLLR